MHCVVWAPVHTEIRPAQRTIEAMSLLSRISRIATAAATAVAVLVVLPVTAHAATAPSAPGSPVIGVRTATTVAVTWAAPTDTGGSPITRYDLYRDGVKITSTPSRQYTFGTLTGGTWYALGVTACNLFGCSDLTAITDAKTAPALPTQLRATQGSGELTVNWTASANAADGSESVWYRASTTSTWSLAGSDGATSPVTISSLSNGTTYAVKVRVSTPYGDSETTAVLATPMAVPTTPTLTIASVSSTGAVLAWDAPNATTAAPTYYEIYRDGVKVASPTQRSYAASGLTPDTLYAFSVKSCNAVGCSAASTEAAVPVPPSPATKLATTAGEGQVTVAWTNSPQATNNFVQYKEASSSVWLDWAPADAAISPVVVTGLRGGVLHSFRVATIGTVTALAYSSIITATPIGTPSVVSGIRQTAASADSVTVAWSAPLSGGSPITGYAVYADGVLVAERPANSASAVISGLTAGESVVVTVAASNALGAGSASSGFTAYATPIAPSELAAAPSATSFALSWSGSTSVSVTSYKVMYRKKGTSNWVSGPTVSSSQTSVTLSSLAALTEYEMYVRALTPGSFADTAVKTASTTAVAAPGVPTDVVATPTLNGFTLSWAAPVDNGGSPVTDYAIYYRLGDTAPVLYQDPVSSSRTITITGVTYGSYTFTVLAKNSAGEGALSDPSSPASPYAAPGLVLPQNANSGTSGNVLLTWNAPEFDGNSSITGYVVQYSTNGGSYWTTHSTEAGADSTTLDVTGLKVGTEHLFRIAAKNALTQGQWAEFQDPVTPVALPATPTGLKLVSLSSGSALLAWNTAPVNGGTFQGYTLQESTNDGATWSELSSWWEGTPTSPAGAMSTYARVSADAGVTTLYRVAAVSSVGYSAFALPIEVTTCDTPGTPGSVSVTHGSGRVDLTWSASTSSGCLLSDYLVQYSVNGSVWVEFQKSPSTATSATVTGLTNGTAYTFRVAAVNAVGSGPWTPQSAFVTPFTTPGAPTAVGARSDGDAVVVSWTAPSSTGGSPITDYDLWYSFDGGTTWTAFMDGVSSATSVRVTGLSLNTAYTFRVAARNAAGVGAFSTSTSPLTYKNPPAAPSDITGTVGSKSVVLSWSAPAYDGGNSIVDYLIQYRRTNATSWTLFADGVSTATTTTVTGLTNGTSYVFRVAAVSSVGSSEYSTLSSELTPFSLPAAPSNVVGVSGASSARLTWTAPGDNGGFAVADYEIQYSTNAGSSWVDVVDGASVTAIATITGLTNGTAYIFKVRAITSKGAGAWSAPSTAVTPTSAPSAPTALVGSASPAAVALSWAAPSSNGGAVISDYVIQRAVSSATPVWSSVAKAVSTSTSFTVTGLTNGTAYVFRVAAKNSRGTGAWSAVSDPVTPRSAPGVPTALKVTASASSVAVSWVAPALNGGASITDYVLQYSANAGVTWSDFTDGTSTAVSATVTGLTNGVAYVFRVAAVNAVGTGSWSTSSAAATPRSAPSAPSNIVATPSAGAVALAWSAPSSNGAAVTNYTVQFSSDGGTTWVVFPRPAGTATTATVTGLLNGVEYSFRVSAQNVLGSSSWSSTATATPVTTPSSPSSVTCSAVPPGVTLSWVAPTSNGGAAITDYVVQFSSNDGATWSTATDGVSASTSTVLPSLATGSYRFRVAAVTSAGQGAYSSSSQACSL